MPKFIPHVEAFCSSLHSSHTDSLASDLATGQTGTWLWEDRRVTAGGQISCSLLWVCLRGHALAVPLGDSVPGPLSREAKGQVSLYPPSPHSLLLKTPVFLLALSSLVWFACSICCLKYWIGFFHPLAATIETDWEPLPFGGLDSFWKRWAVFPVIPVD